MKYNFKYLRNNSHIIPGVLWYFFSVMHVGIIVLFIKNMRTSALFPILGPIFFINLVLSVLLGNYYTAIHKRDYIRIDSKTMSIDNGLIRKRKKVELESIENIKEIGTKLRVGLSSGRDVIIYLELLSLSDIENLSNILEKY